MRVLVNGPASWNTLVALPHLPEPRPGMLTATAWWEGLGGTSAGKSLSLARLGVPTLLRTVVGDDAAGERVLDALRHPLLTVVAQRAPASERHLNLMAHGDRVSVYLDAPDDPGDPPEPVTAALRDADVAVLDLAAHSVPLLDRARRAGTEVWCDLHDDDGVAAFHEPFRAGADVVVVSADRLDDVWGYLEARVAGGARWAVATSGARGAIALGADGRRHEVGTAHVDVVQDTNGAGDAFVAGMLAARLLGAPDDEGLRWGAAAGALCVASRELVAPDLSVERVRALAGTVEHRTV
ncbi:PfkB family carbohydrate kinase [Actinotalea sp. AC32]|nr:PfkB family carbohydrate kinase [Actinotalea sp. AC32]